MREYRLASLELRQLYSIIQPSSKRSDLWWTDRMDREKEKKEKEKIEILWFFRHHRENLKAHAPCFDRLSFFNPLASIRVRVEAIEKWSCYQEKLAGRHLTQSFLPNPSWKRPIAGCYLLNCCENKVLFTLNSVHRYVAISQMFSDDRINLSRLCL